VGSSRWPDIGIVLACAVMISLVSQRWPGFNSPDSEFYASLSLFGSDVVDRAVEPSYFWTRLGYIAPVRLLVTVLGPWVGFEVWRVLLIALITAAVYSLVHVAGRPRGLGLVLALAVGLNTVILSFVGNTYLTGTLLAGIFLVLALAVSQLGSVASRGRGLFGSPRWTTGLLIGVVFGWLVMTNPYGLLLAAAMWGAVRVAVLVLLQDERWKRLLIDASMIGVGFLISAGGFLLAGRVIFPGRDWLATYLEWNSRLDYTVFIGDATTWQRDTALIVVVVAVLASIISVIVYPTRRWGWAALAISVANVAATIVLMVLFTGPWLESPTYVALLWPGALSALSLVFISMVPGTHDAVALPPRVFLIAAVLVAGLLIAVGRYEDTLGLLAGWLIGAAAVLFIALVALAARPEVFSVRRVSILLVVALLTTFVGAQVLQNGRGFLGIYGQYPFAGAYGDYQVQEQMQAKITTQEWLLGRTSRQDSIMIWTDPAGLGASTAAMQLWGGDNLATLDAVLTRETRGRLEQVQPSVLAMYSPTQDLIDDFYASLPPWSLPSDLECTREPFPVVPSGEVITCLTRLTWIG